MKRSINILLFVFAVFAFSANMVFTQSTTDKGWIDLQSFSWGTTKIELVSKDGKTVISTTTDAKGNFTFQTIPVGNYTFKFSKRNGTVPKTGILFFNGVKEIVCCCPGPPCDDPIVLIVAEKRLALKKGQLFLEKTSRFTGNIKSN